MSEEHKPAGKEWGPPPSPLERKLRYAFFIGLAVIAILNVFIVAPNPHFGLDKYPEFWAVFGVLGAVILGRFAKGLAHTFLGKNEDFYERENPSKAGEAPVEHHQQGGHH